MKSLLFSLTIFVISTTSSAAQIDEFKELSTDSLCSWLLENAYSDLVFYPEVANYTISKAIEQDEYGLAARTHGTLSFWYYVNYQESSLDTMIYHRLKQIEYDEKINNMLLAGEGYTDLAIDYMNSNQLRKAQNALLKSIEILESLDNKVEVNEAYANLALLYNDLDEPSKALHYAELSLPMVTEVKDYLVMVNILLAGFTYAYIDLEDYPNALESINKSIYICIQNEFNQREFALTESYNLKGKILLEQGDLDAAALFFEKAFQAGKEHLSADITSSYRFGIGRVFFLKGDYKQALPHLIAGVNAASAGLDFEPNHLRILSQCYEKLGEYPEALKYSVEYSELDQQIANDKISNLESENLAKYESGRKDQELLEQTNIISQKNKIQGLIIGAIVILAILLSILFYYFRRNKKTSALLLEKNEEIEKRNQQNELLLKEIHHRVKNNLQTVSSLLSLQSESIKDKSSYDAILESKNRVSSMALIHQKLYQGENLAAIEMRDYFKTVGMAIIDSFGQRAENISLTVEMNNVELDVDTAIPIGLITNELITNSIKHAFPDKQKGEIFISLEQEGNGLLKLNVRDNGQPATNESLNVTEKGFGTLLIQLLTTQLRGELAHSSEAGTSTIIQFPMQEKSVA